jgi:hypothetical protein
MQPDLARADHVLRSQKDESHKSARTLGPLPVRRRGSTEPGTPASAGCSPGAGVVRVAGGAPDVTPSS